MVDMIADMIMDQEDMITVTIMDMDTIMVTITDIHMDTVMVVIATVVNHAVDTM